MSAGPCIVESTCYAPDRSNRRPVVNRRRLQSSVCRTTMTTTYTRSWRAVTVIRPRTRYTVIRYSYSVCHTTTTVLPPRTLCTVSSLGVRMTLCCLRVACDTVTVRHVVTLWLRVVTRRIQPRSSDYTYYIITIIIIIVVSGRLCDPALASLVRVTTTQRIYIYFFSNRIFIVFCDFHFLQLVN